MGPQCFIRSAFNDICIQEGTIENRRSQGLLVHSDRGVQYACVDFRKLLQKNKFVQSMSRKGDFWDNAVAESFSHTL